MLNTKTILFKLCVMNIYILLLIFIYQLEVDPSSWSVYVIPSVLLLLGKRHYPISLHRHGFGMECMRSDYGGRFG